MTNEQIEKLEQIHTTLGLIHSAHAERMTPDEQALFARAIEELFDVIDTAAPDPGPGVSSEWPESHAGRWSSLR